MMLEEAQAWLRGDRTMANLIPQDPFETWQVRISQADAAMIQIAYWVAKAWKEGRKTELEIRERIAIHQQEVEEEELNGGNGSEDWLLAAMARDELRWVLGE